MLQFAEHNRVAIFLAVIYGHLKYHRSHLIVTTVIELCYLRHDNIHLQNGISSYITPL